MSNLTWPTKRLGEVLIRKPQYGLTAKSSEEKKEFRYIRITDITDEGKLKTENPKYVDLGEKEFNKYKLEKWDFLIARSGSVGRVYLHQNLSEPCVYASYLIRFKLDHEKILPEFLFYYALSPHYKWFIVDTLRSVAQPNINAQEFSKLQIPLPPLNIQKQIVAKIEEVFGRIDKAIELRKKALEETTQIFPSALQEVFSKAGKKWGVEKLGGICERIKQSHPRNIFKSEFSYIDITSIDPLSKSIFDTKKFSVNQAPHRARKLVKEGDTIFATTRPYLKNIAYISKNFNNYVVSTGFCVIRPKMELANPLYVFFIVNSESFISQVLPFQRGASYPAVSDSNVYNCKLPLPPIPEQKRIVSYLDGVREKVEKLKKCQESQLKDLEELKQSLLQQAFGG